MIDWLYHAGFESSLNQGTLGKMACGRGCRHAGEPDLLRAGDRSLLREDPLRIPLCVGFAMVGWTREKRGLHDFLAGTVVLRA